MSNLPYGPEISRWTDAHKQECTHIHQSAIVTILSHSLQNVLKKSINQWVRAMLFTTFQIQNQGAVKCSMNEPLVSGNVKSCQRNVTKK